MLEAFSPTYGDTDCEGLLRCLRREGAPRRVHFMELFLDGEVKAELCRRGPILDGLDERDPAFPLQAEILIQRFLGYDYVRCGARLTWPRGGPQSTAGVVEDTAGLRRAGGRGYVDEHVGYLTNWDQFEQMEWPDPERADTRALEWYEKNLPDDMCLFGTGGAHFYEHLSWLMGYETLAYALYEDRDLVAAISDKLIKMAAVQAKCELSFTRVKGIWGSDDMGFRSGLLISPDDLRAFILPGHRQTAKLAHDAGKLYLLHSCGKLALIMEDLIEDVRIDARHSFEDVAEPVAEVKRRYGDRVSLIGGIDMDFLCRATEAQVRRRVRETLDVCLPGGGYCLGTGNSVANYLPVENYLAMLDEGRRYARS
jgi:uroporphyrinogen decarboxylase